MKRATFATTLQTLVGAVFVIAAAANVSATPINTNDNSIYTTFATGATVQNFESVSGMTPLALDSYANALNSSTAVPTAAQLSLDDRWPPVPQRRRQFQRPDRGRKAGNADRLA